MRPNPLPRPNIVKVPKGMFEACPKCHCVCLESRAGHILRCEQNPAVYVSTAGGSPQLSRMSSLPQRANAGLGGHARAGEIVPKLQLHRQDHRVHSKVWIHRLLLTSTLLVFLMAVNANTLCRLLRTSGEESGKTYSGGASGGGGASTRF